jgi:hypothetical protein
MLSTEFEPETRAITGLPGRPHDRWDRTRPVLFHPIGHHSSSLASQRYAKLLKFRYSVGSSHVSKFVTDSTPGDNWAASRHICEIIYF